MLTASGLSQESEGFEPHFDITGFTMDVYRLSLQRMTPAEAGATWARTAMHPGLLSDQMHGYYPGDDFVIFDLLPGPDSWPSILTTLNGMKANGHDLVRLTSLKAFAYGLNGDLPKAWREVQKLPETKELELAKFEAMYQLARATKNVRWTVQTFATAHTQDRYFHADVPDLTRMEPMAQAVADYRSILRGTGVDLQFQGAGADICRKIIREDKSLVNVSQPSLQRTVPDHRESRQAVSRAVEGAHNLTNNEIGDIAGEVCRSDYLDEFAKPGAMQYIDDILYRARKSGLEVKWLALARSAVAATTTDRAEALMSADIKIHGPGSDEFGAGGALVWMLLATDQVDKAIDSLRSQINSSGPLATRVSRILTMATVGKALGRSELVKEAISDAKSIGFVGEAYSWMLLNGLEHEAIAWAKSNRAFEAESFKVDRRDPEERCLASYYSGDYAEVERILDKDKEWWRADLAECGFKTQLIASKSLHMLGRTQDAVRIARHILKSFPEEEEAYTWLHDLIGKKALPDFKAACAATVNNDRPLVYTAQVLQELGELAEAESFALRAERLIVFDFNSWKKPRLHAATILAKIYASKGASKLTQKYRDRVSALQLLTDATRLNEVGLCQRAARKLEAAARLAPDLHAIFGERATVLHSLGRYEECDKDCEAMIRLRARHLGAAELGPWYIEAENAPSRLQVIAKRILPKLASDDPKNENIHLLLGQLYQREFQYEAARTQYLMACRLRPDLLQAWWAFVEVDKNCDFPSDSRPAAEAAILRKLPAGVRVFDYHVRSVTDGRDFATYYRRFDQDRANSIPKVGVYRLTASAPSVEKLKYYVSSAPLGGLRMRWSGLPGEALLQNRLLSSLMRGYSLR